MGHELLSLRASSDSGPPIEPPLALLALPANVDMLQSAACTFRQNVPTLLAQDLGIVACRLRSACCDSLASFR